MTRTAFERVNDGQPWTPPHAVEWNAMLEVAKNRFGTSVRPNQIDRHGLWGSHLVVGFNPGGSSTDAGTPVTLMPTGDPTSDDFVPQVFDLGTPDENARGRWGICQDQIESQEYGHVAVGGLAYVLVDIKHDSHVRCDVNATGVLESSFAGTAEIMHKWGAGTGGRWCLIRFPVLDHAEVKGKANQDIEPDVAPPSENVDVWQDGADTGAKIEAHLNWMHGDQKISSGKEVIARWFGDELKWVVVHAECEDPPPTP